ncbi:general secretion pathway protein GspB [Ferrimonas balearica]|uniref:general secretion pathway protein GspB n=1 Tax=Ferrimonas balearica TaxID=44012 RepID=UPI001C9962B3|nr:general secretion pathway protein GspB [Ferrimonas balearica]MBY5993701.1 general secretion pathway protein GspB [Ferrimonas balearica]
MSLLLDAVKRARHSEAAQHDPALAPELPTRRKPARPWIWSLPLVTLAVGAAAGWASVVLTANPNDTAAAPPEAPPYTLAGRVNLPLPTAVVSTPASERVPLDDLPVVVERPSAPADTPVRQPAPEPQPQLAAASEPVAQADPALLAAFEQALAEMGDDVLTPQPRLAQPVESPLDLQPDPGVTTVPAAEVPKLGQMPWAFQKRVPDVAITAHVYATNPADRWLRANGRELQEGDEAAPGLTVSEILPNEVVLEMDGERFRIPALGSI